MARSADPVQAARKAAVKREAKRNRERKDQAQEARTLRQDTRSLEQQIQRLESRQGSLSEDDQSELRRLQAEVASVKRIKEEYVRKHPDQRNFVRGYEGASNSSSCNKADQTNSLPRSQPQRTHGTPRHGQDQAALAKQKDPRWSIYYDATFNPYGAPPPGMPYLEKPFAQLVDEGLVDAAKPPPLPEETAGFEDLGADQDSDDSSTDEDLKDIIMPSGRPPIRLLPAAAEPRAHRAAGRGRGQREPPRGGGNGPVRGGRGRGSVLSRPHPTMQGSPHHRGGHVVPHPVTVNLPMRPLPTSGVPPSTPVANAHISYPSSSTQASGPPGPPGPPPAIPDGVVISAEPQLRDFKKESTAFVPAAIRKKQQEEKARTRQGLPGRIDAAPTSNNMTDSGATPNRDKPDLLKSLQVHLPSKGASGSTSRDGDAGSQSKRNDYDRFLDEVADIL